MRLLGLTLIAALTAQSVFASEQTNQSLSEARAEAVSEFLGQSVSPRPTSANNNDQEQNRRVEILLTSQ